MAATITLVSDAGNLDWGPIPCSLIVVTPDTSYPSGGYALTAANCYCGRGITGMSQIGCNTAAVGYIPIWNTQTGKFMILVPGGSTPAGTLSGNVVVTTGTIAQAIGITPDSNAGVLTTAGSTRTIPYATFLGGALTFTGSAGTSGTQASGNLSTLAFTMVCFGQR